MDIRMKSHSLSSVQTGNVRRPSTIKDYFLTKHVDVVLSGQTVWYMFEWTKCLTMFDQMASFKLWQTRSNKRDNVWSPNNIWLCLIARQFPFWLSFLLMCTCPLQRHFSSLLWERKNAFHDCLSTSPINRIKWMKKKTTDPFFNDLSARALTVACAHAWLSLIVDRCYDVEGKMKGMMK